MGFLLAYLILLGAMCFVPVLLDTKKPGDSPIWHVMPVWAKATVAVWSVCTITLAIGLVFF